MKNLGITAFLAFLVNLTLNAQHNAQLGFNALKIVSSPVALADEGSHFLYAQRSLELYGKIFLKQKAIRLSFGQHRFINNNVSDNPLCQREYHKATALTLGLEHRWKKGKFSSYAYGDFMLKGERFSCFDAVTNIGYFTNWSSELGMTLGGGVEYQLTKRLGFTYEMGVQFISHKLYTKDSLFVDGNPRSFAINFQPVHRLGVFWMI